MGGAGSMKSTWRTWDPSEWNTAHKALDRLDHRDLDRQVPVHQKTDRMPYVPHYQIHKWILSHACAPLLLHGLITHFTGYNFHPALAFIFYFTAFRTTGGRTTRMLKELGHRWGYFDGDKHARDDVPDADVSNVLSALLLTASGRSMMILFCAYDRRLPPWTLSPWVVLEMGVHQVLLDFYFYWYHRALHTTDGLWRFHRKHHTAKHPNPLLSLYADGAQELGDVFGIPLLTYATMRFVLGFPMGFYDWWVCQMYVVVTEVWGHSGLRVYSTPASSATPLLWALGCELTTEDHDLHHRIGWKKSHNYGKQTLLWDRLFGTVGTRLETTEATVDWGMPLRLPLSFTGFQEPSDFRAEKKRE